MYSIIVAILFAIRKISVFKICVLEFSIVLDVALATALGTRVAESEVKYPTQTFPKLPAPSP